MRSAVKHALAHDTWDQRPAPGAWVSRGACRGAPTDLFFPEEPGEAEAAIQVCRRCPVRAECAAYALGIPGLEGIWGGLTEADRRRHRRRSADPVTAAHYPRCSGGGKGGAAHAHRCPR
jgi:WhiB family transcriptional regulator, redox-sensing transcriptional regulator